MKDVFDRIKPDPDIFDSLEKKKKETDFFAEVERKVPSLIRSYIKEQVVKNPVLSEKDVLSIVKAEIVKVPPIEKVIERQVVKTIETKIETPKNLAHQSDIEDLKKVTKDLKKEIAEKQGNVIITGAPMALPNYNGKNGKFLSVGGNRLAWVDAPTSEVDLTPNFTQVTAQQVLTDNLTLTGNGTLFGLDAIDETTVFTLQGALEFPSYTLAVGAAIDATPVDGETVYFGSFYGSPPSPAAALSRVYIPRAGTIRTIYLVAHAETAGSNEAWIVNVRLNNTTSTLIAQVSANTNVRIFSNSILNIVVSLGDYLEIEVVNPTWETNPANVRWGGQIYID